MVFKLLGHERQSKGSPYELRGSGGIGNKVNNKMKPEDYKVQERPSLNSP